MGGVSRAKSSPRVAVVTVSFRSSEAVSTLIHSLHAASAQPLETVVVDNLPGGDSDLEVALRGSTARVVHRPDNPGYGGGINAGVATLSPSIDWILVVNPDVVLHAGCVDALVAVGDADDSVGAVGPLIRDGHGETYPSARAIPSLRVGIGHALLGDIAPRNRWTRRYHQHSDYDEERDAGWLSGACVLVRRTAFDEVGGFDEGFFMYFEDVDLGYRLGQHGWRSRFAPRAFVEHEGGHSTKAHSDAMIAAHHASARRWIAKRYRGIAWSPVRLTVSTGLRLRQAIIRRN